MSAQKKGLFLEGLQFLCEPAETTRASEQRNYSVREDFESGQRLNLRFILCFNKHTMLHTARG